MEQLGQELKKVLKAGIGAVATGLEIGQDALECLAQKGEPLYQQAKSAVADAADKVKQAVTTGFGAMDAEPQVQEIIDILRGMTRDDWAQVRAALDEFEAQAAEAEKAAKEAAEAAEEIMKSAEQDCEEAPAAEKAEEPVKEEPASSDPADE